MDADLLRQWQLLHGRVMQGDVLKPTEQALYETGCHALDAEECLDGDLTRLRELRSSIAEAEVELLRLREREAVLDAQIKDLERNLDQRTRQLLGVSA